MIDLSDSSSAKKTLFLTWKPLQQSCNRVIDLSVLLSVFVSFHPGLPKIHTDQVTEVNKILVRRIVSYMFTYMYLAELGPLNTFVV